MTDQKKRTIQIKRRTQETTAPIPPLQYGELAANDTKLYMGAKDGKNVLINPDVIALKNIIWCPKFSMSYTMGPTVDNNPTVYITWSSSLGPIETDLYYLASDRDPDTDQFTKILFKPKVSCIVKMTVYVDKCQNAGVLSVRQKYGDHYTNAETESLLFRKDRPNFGYTNILDIPNTVIVRPASFVDLFEFDPGKEYGISLAVNDPAQDYMGVILEIFPK